MTIKIYYWTPLSFHYAMLQEVMELYRKRFLEDNGVTVDDPFQVRDRVNALALDEDPETKIPLPTRCYLAEEASAIALHANALFVESPDWHEDPEGRWVVDLALSCGIPVFINHHIPRQEWVRMTGLSKKNYVTWLMYEPDTKNSQFMSRDMACLYVWNLSK